MRAELLLLLAVTACILPPAEDDDPLREASKPQDLTVNWTLKTAAGATAPCPAGFDTLDLQWIPDTSTGGFEDLVPCASTGTVTRTLYTDGTYHWPTTPDDPTQLITELAPRYSVFVVATDPTGQLVRARSIETRVDLATGAKTLDIELYPDAGFAALSWHFYTELTTTTSATCEAVGIDTIEYRYRPFADETAPLVVDRWPCDAKHPIYAGFSEEDVGSGLTRPLVPGDYVGTLYALRGGVEVGAKADVGVPVTGNDEVKQLPETIDIPDR